MRKFWAIAAAVFLGSICCAAEPYAAIVNGEIIPLSEFDAAVENAQKALSMQNTLDLESEEGRFLMMTTQQSILDDMINQLLIRQQARQLKIVITTADVTEEIARLRRGFPTQKLFEETLAEEHINSEDLLDGVRSRLVSEKIKKELSRKLDVSDKELNNFLRQNQDFFVQDEHRQYAQILLASQEEAAQVYAQLQDGADFAELAKTHSLDEQAKLSGGDIGYIGPGAYRPEVEDIIFNLREGEISPVLELPENYAIFRCTYIIATPPEDIDQSSNEARKYLLRKKENEIFERWFTKTKNAAKIEINPAIKLQENFPLPPDSFPHHDKTISHERV